MLAMIDSYVFAGGELAGPRNEAEEVRVHRDPTNVGPERHAGLQPVAGEGPPWEALRSNLARLGDLLFTPTSFVVVGVRQR